MKRTLVCCFWCLYVCGSNAFLLTRKVSEPQSATARFNKPRFAADDGIKTQYTIDESVCPPTRPHLLQKAVSKACASLPFFLARKPIAKHTQKAFDDVLALIEEAGLQSKAIVLDSGCGTGRSTKLLADLHKNSVVIGVDRSFSRLTKSSSTSDDLERGELDQEGSKRPFCSKVADNAFLVRAELVDFWICCQNANLRVAVHYILYPNPYPTQTRLTQRWYAHPSFPLLLGLESEMIVVRSNWKGYLDEFSRSVGIAAAYYQNADPVHDVATCYLKGLEGPYLRDSSAVSWSNFEEKYDASGEPTYELRVMKDNSV